VTVQKKDTILHNDTNFALLSVVKGRNLLKLSDLNIQPSIAGSCCWRGYCAEFEVAESRLYLKKLWVNIHQRQNGPSRLDTVSGPVIDGVAPRVLQKEPPAYHLFNNLYENLNRPVRFTGILLLASDLIRSLSLRNWDSKFDYNHVIELAFADGVLKSERDRSIEIAEERRKRESPRTKSIRTRELVNLQNSTLKLLLRRKREKY
jgi:hypothetical protein